MKAVIHVDLNDNEITHIEKLSAHKNPVLHRAFSIFLVDKSRSCKYNIFCDVKMSQLWSLLCILI